MLTRPLSFSIKFFFIIVISASSSSSSFSFYSVCQMFPLRDDYTTFYYVCGFALSECDVYTITMLLHLKGTKRRPHNPKNYTYMLNQSESESLFCPAAWSKWKIKKKNKIVILYHSFYLLCVYEWWFCMIFFFFFIFSSSVPSYSFHLLLLI